MALHQLEEDVLLQQGIAHKQVDAVNVAPIFLGNGDILARPHGSPTLSLNDQHIMRHRAQLTHMPRRSSLEEKPPRSALDPKTVDLSKCDVYDIERTLSEVFIEALSGDSGGPMRWEQLLAWLRVLVTLDDETSRVLQHMDGQVAHYVGKTLMMIDQKNITDGPLESALRAAFPKVVRQARRNGSILSTLANRSRPLVAKPGKLASIRDMAVTRVAETAQRHRGLHSAVLSRKSRRGTGYAAAKNDGNRSVDVETIDDVLEYLTLQEACTGRGEDVFYLNHINRYPAFDPYGAWAVVPKSDVEAEHLMVTPTCLLHVTPPNGESEHFTYDRFVKEAFQFRILASKRVFRQYRIRKSFHAWRAETRHAKFCCAKSALEKNALIMHSAATYSTLCAVQRELCRLDMAPLVVFENACRYTLTDVVEQFEAGKERMQSTVARVVMNIHMAASAHQQTWYQHLRRSTRAKVPISRRVNAHAKERASIAKLARFERLLLAMLHQRLVALGVHGLHRDVMPLFDGQTVCLRGTDGEHRVDVDTPGQMAVRVVAGTTAVPPTSGSGGNLVEPSHADLSAAFRQGMQHAMTKLAQLLRHYGSLRAAALDTSVDAHVAGFTAHMDGVVAAGAQDIDVRLSVAFDACMSQARAQYGWVVADKKIRETMHALATWDSDALAAVDATWSECEIGDNIRVLSDVRDHALLKVADLRLYAVAVRLFKLEWVLFCKARQWNSVVTPWAVNDRTDGTATTRGTKVRHRLLDIDATSLVLMVPKLLGVMRDMHQVIRVRFDRRARRLLAMAQTLEADLSEAMELDLDDPLAGAEFVVRCRKFEKAYTRMEEESDDVLRLAHEFENLGREHWSSFGATCDYASLEAVRDKLQQRGVQVSLRLSAAVKLAANTSAVVDNLLSNIDAWFHAALHTRTLACTAPAFNTPGCVGAGVALHQLRHLLDGHTAIVRDVTTAMHSLESVLERPQAAVLRPFAACTAVLHARIDLWKLVVDVNKFSLTTMHANMATVDVSASVQRLMTWQTACNTAAAAVHDSESLPCQPPNTYEAESFPPGGQEAVSDATSTSGAAAVVHALVQKLRELRDVYAIVRALRHPGVRRTHLATIFAQLVQTSDEDDTAIEPDLRSYTLADGERLGLFVHAALVRQVTHAAAHVHTQRCRLDTTARAWLSLRLPLVHRTVPLPPAPATRTGAGQGGKAGAVARGSATGRTRAQQRWRLVAQYMVDTVQRVRAARRASVGGQTLTSQLTRTILGPGAVDLLGDSGAVEVALRDLGMGLQSLATSCADPSVRHQADVLRADISSAVHLVEEWQRFQRIYLLVARMLQAPTVAAAVSPAVHQVLVTIDATYRAVAAQAYGDTKVASVLGWLYGHERHRQYQGATLRTFLADGIASLQHFLDTVETAYFATARSYCPRLGFLAWGAMAALLACPAAPSPARAHPVLGCFQHVSHLECCRPGDDVAVRKGTAPWAVQGLVGLSQGNTLVFARPILAHDAEDLSSLAWCNDVLDAMRGTIQYQLHACFSFLVDKLPGLSVPVADPSTTNASQPCVGMANDQCFRTADERWVPQVVLVALDMLFAHTVTQSLSNDAWSLENCRHLHVRILKVISADLRACVSSGAGAHVYVRRQNLLQRALHHVAVLDGMLRAGASMNATSFDWHLQPRYYLLADRCEMQQLNVVEVYGCEFEGLVGNHLVLTPLTQRALLSVHSALRERDVAVLHHTGTVDVLDVIATAARLVGRFVHTLWCAREGGTPAVDDVRRCVDAAYASASWLVLHQACGLDGDVLSVLDADVANVRVAAQAPSAPSVPSLVSCGVVCTRLSDARSPPHRLSEHLRDRFRNIHVRPPAAQVVLEAQLWGVGNKGDVVHRLMEAIDGKAPSMLTKNERWKSILHVVRRIQHLDAVSMHALESLLMCTGGDTNDSSGSMAGVAAAPHTSPDPCREDMREDGTFPPMDGPNADDTLIHAITEVCSDRALVPTRGFVRACVDLHNTLHCHPRIVAVVGGAGGGKSTCVETLAAARARLEHTPNVTRIYTGAHSTPDLLGAYRADAPREWCDGTLVKILRSVAAACHDTNSNGPMRAHWVVLDVAGDAAAVSTVLGSLLEAPHGALVLPTGECISIPSEVVILLELDAGNGTASAVLGVAAVVRVADDAVTVQAIITAWLSTVLVRQPAISDATRERLGKSAAGLLDLASLGDVLREPHRRGVTVAAQVVTVFNALVCDVVHDTMAIQTLCMSFVHVLHGACDCSEEKLDVWLRRIFNKVLPDVELPPHGHLVEHAFISGTTSGTGDADKNTRAWRMLYQLQSYTATRYVLHMLLKAGQPVLVVDDCPEAAAEFVSTVLDGEKPSSAKNSTSFDIIAIRSGTEVGTLRRILHNNTTAAAPACYVKSGHLPHTVQHSTRSRTLLLELVSTPHVSDNNHNDTGTAGTSSHALASATPMEVIREAVDGRGLLHPSFVPAHHRRTTPMQVMLHVGRAIDGGNVIPARLARHFVALRPVRRSSQIVEDLCQSYFETHWASIPRLQPFIGTTSLATRHVYELLQPRESTDDGVAFAWTGDPQVPGTCGHLDLRHLMPALERLVAMCRCTEADEGFAVSDLMQRWRSELSMAVPTPTSTAAVSVEHALTTLTPRSASGTTPHDGTSLPLYYDAARSRLHHGREAVRAFVLSATTRHSTAPWGLPCLTSDVRLREFCALSRALQAPSQPVVIVTPEEGHETRTLRCCARLHGYTDVRVLRVDEDTEASALRAELHALRNHAASSPPRGKTLILLKCPRLMPHVLQAVDDFPLRQTCRSAGTTHEGDPAATVCVVHHNAGTDAEQHDAVASLAQWCPRVWHMAHVAVWAPYTDKELVSYAQNVFQHVCHVDTVNGNRADGPPMGNPEGNIADASVDQRLIQRATTYGQGMIALWRGVVRPRLTHDVKDDVAIHYTYFRKFVQNTTGAWRVRKCTMQAQATEIHRVLEQFHNVECISAAFAAQRKVFSADLHKQNDLCRTHFDEATALRSKLTHVLHTAEELRSEATMSQQQLDDLREQFHVAFADTLETLERTQRGLRAMDPKSIEEIATYQNPPERVVHVFKYVCWLLRYMRTPSNYVAQDPRLPALHEEPTWAEAKLLLLDDFLGKIEVFNKDHIDDTVLRVVRRVVDEDPAAFEHDALVGVSRALPSVAGWVKSVVGYAVAKKELEPLTSYHRELQENLQMLNAKLRGLATKETKLRHALRKAKADMHDATIVRDSLIATVQDFDRKISRIDTVCQAFASRRRTLETGLERLQRLLTDHVLLGDALVSGAYATVRAHVAASAADDVLAELVACCTQHGIVASTTPLHPPPHVGPTTMDEESDIVYFPAFDGHTQEATRLMRTQAVWPLVYDPFGAGERWLRAVCADTGVSVATVSVLVGMERLTAAVSAAQNANTPLLIVDAEDMWTCLPPSGMDFLYDTMAATLGVDDDGLGVACDGQNTLLPFPQGFRCWLVHHTPLQSGPRMQRDRNRFASVTFDSSTLCEALLVDAINRCIHTSTVDTPLRPVVQMALRETIRSSAVQTETISAFLHTLSEHSFDDDSTVHGATVLSEAMEASDSAYTRNIESLATRASSVDMNVESIAAHGCRVFRILQAMRENTSKAASVPSGPSKDFYGCPHDDFHSFTQTFVHSVCETLNATGEGLAGAEYAMEDILSRAHHAVFHDLHDASSELACLAFLLAIAVDTQRCAFEIDDDDCEYLFSVLDQAGADDVAQPAVTAPPLWKAVQQSLNTDGKEWEAYLGCNHSLVDLTPLCRERIHAGDAPLTVFAKLLVLLRFASASALVPVKEYIGYVLGDSFTHARVGLSVHAPSATPQTMASMAHRNTTGRANANTDSSGNDDSVIDAGVDSTNATLSAQVDAIARTDRPWLVVCDDASCDVIEHLQFLRQQERDVLQQIGHMPADHSKKLRGEHGSEETVETSRCDRDDAEQGGGQWDGGIVCVPAVCLHSAHIVVTHVAEALRERSWLVVTDCSAQHWSFLTQLVEVTARAYRGDVGKRHGDLAHSPAGFRVWMLVVGNSSSLLPRALVGACKTVCLETFALQPDLRMAARKMWLTSIASTTLPPTSNLPPPTLPSATLLPTTLATAENVDIHHHRNAQIDALVRMATAQEGARSARNASDALVVNASLLRGLARYLWSGLQKEVSEPLVPHGTTGAWSVRHAAFAIANVLASSVRNDGDTSADMDSWVEHRASAFIAAFTTAFPFVGVDLSTMLVRESDVWRDLNITPLWMEFFGCTAEDINATRTMGVAAVAPLAVSVLRQMWPQ